MSMYHHQQVQHVGEYGSSRLAAIGVTALATIAVFALFAKDARAEPTGTTQADTTYTRVSFSPADCTSSSVPGQLESTVVITNGSEFKATFYHGNITRHFNDKGDDGTIDPEDAVHSYLGGHQMLSTPEADQAFYTGLRERLKSGAACVHSVDISGTVVGSR